tara:strand:+ start:15506 stop:15841 length:336 start_codon:yes stop_codon:yes gene_type:complete
MADLLCESWILDDTTSEGIVSIDAATGEEFADIKIVAKELRVFGTKKQIKEVGKKYNIDEVFEYKVEKEGSYWYKIYNNPEEENARVAKKLKEYKLLYELNNREVLILRIR